MEKWVIPCLKKFELSSEALIQFRIDITKVFQAKPDHDITDKEALATWKRVGALDNMKLLEIEFYKPETDTSNQDINRVDFEGVNF